MDVLPRITRQLIELFRAMSLVQRATFVAVPLLMLGGFAWLLIANRPDDEQAVSFGKAFGSEELSAAERALDQAGLTNYRREGRKLLAPASQLDRYNAALVEFDAVPSDLGSQMLKQFESLGPFTTDRQRQEMKEALLLQELRRMIEAVPDIEHARVAVANSGRRVSFGQKPRVTANVTVKPRAGRDLSARLVASLRQAVASMVPDLNPDDVTVFDVARGQTYSGEAADDPLDSRLIQRVREFTRQYEQQIQKALAFIPNANVAVHVDLDNLKSSVTRNERTRVRSDASRRDFPPRRVEPTSFTDEPQSHAALRVNRDGASDSTSDGLTEGPSHENSDVLREVSERQLLAAMPRAVQVSVSIPRDYYRQVAANRQAQGEKQAARLSLDTIEEEMLSKVERTVARLIPANSPHEAISVTTVDRLSGDTSEPVLTTNEQFLVLTQRHGGSAALCLFAVWALWMLTRLTAPPTRVAVLPSVELTESAAPPGPHHEFMTPETLSEAVPAATVSLAQSVVAPPSVAAELQVPAPTNAFSSLHEEIRSLAEADPATAASVLSRWLEEANA